MGKKWYDLFVVKDASGQGREEEVESVSLADAMPQEIAGPVSESATPEAIYAAAQINTPSHGFSILKVATMLESEHIRELPADVRRKSVLVALDAAQVPIKDVVEDAVRRDRALDTYERVLEKNLDAQRVATVDENQRLEAEIVRLTTELRTRIDQNDRALAQAREQFAVWRLKKQTEEARIAAAAGFFVDENPISLATGEQE